MLRRRGSRPPICIIEKGKNDVILQPDGVNGENVIVLFPTETYQVNCRQMTCIVSFQKISSRPSVFNVFTTIRVYMLNTLTIYIYGCGITVRYRKCNRFDYTLDAINV